MLMFLPSITYAEQTGEYQFFTCDNTESCTGNCNLLDRSANFLIDKKKSAVMAKIFEGGVMQRTLLFEQCKAIFDEKNWDCTTQMGNIWIQIRMANGVYLARTTSFTMSSNDLNAKVISNVCAK